MDVFVRLLLTNPKGFVVLVAVLAAYFVGGWAVIELHGWWRRRRYWS